jgi:MFS family permease
MSLTIGQATKQRIVGALFVSQSLFSAAAIAAFTLSSIIAADLSGSEGAAGLPNTLTLLGRASVAFPLGWLLDQIGRRRGLAAGLLIGVLGSALMAYAVVTSSFVYLLVGSVLLGASRAASEQSRYVAAEVFRSGRQAKVIGLVVTAGTLGAIGGPLLVDPSGQAVMGWGLPYMAGPFIASAGLLVLAALVVTLFLRPDPLQIGRQISAAEELEADRVAGASGVPVDRSARPLRQIFGRAPALLAVASMTTGQLVMVMLMVITPLHMDRAHHGTHEISMVIMAHTLGMFGLSWLTGWLIDRFGRMPMIFAGAAVLAGACIMAPGSTALPALALALFLLGLGWNFCFVAGSSLLSDELRSRERGRAQGAGETLVALGAGAGSLGSGILFSSGGIVTVSAVGLGLSLALMVPVIWLRVARPAQRALAHGRE